MNPVNPNFMPTLRVPVRLCQELESFDVDSKINGNMSYEVIGKDEYGVELSIKHIAPTIKLRKF